MHNDNSLAKEERTSRSQIDSEAQFFPEGGDLPHGRDKHSPGTSAGFPSSHWRR
jgi:hypothetical protein